jgi:hypothetical protein
MQKAIDIGKIKANQFDQSAENITQLDDENDYSD